VVAATRVQASVALFAAWGCVNGVRLFHRKGQIGGSGELHSTNIVLDLPSNCNGVRARLGCAGVVQVLHPNTHLAVVIRLIAANDDSAVGTSLLRYYFTELSL
jgi:hypothetical protein